MKHKQIDYSKAVSSDVLLPYYNDTDLDHSDKELYESTFAHICNIMEANKLDWRQVIQTIGMLKMVFISGMLENRISYDEHESREALK